MKTSNNTNYKTKPFVKWAGGKRQLISKIIPLLPSDYKRYIEPFIGGGALLFYLQPKNAIINDINKDLILTYQNIKNDIEFKMLIKELNKYKKNHENSENQKLFYTKVRSGKPKSNINISARFLYLNKACFNGLYRVNSNNEFNVPFNGSKKINIYDEDNINNINKYLSENKIKIFNKDYLSILDMSKDGDFIFCDPPYDTDTNQFTSYTKDCFNRQNQVDLFNKLVDLDKKNIKWMITNHDTDFIKELYKDFNSTIVKVNRSINSKGNNRKNSCNEIIITNYDAGIS